MDWLSTDPTRPGVFAVGQVARGVIAIGQGAVGVVAIGQGAIGIVYAAAMLGVAGRGFGGVLQLFPKIRVERFERPAVPPLSELSELERGDKDQGWVLAKVVGTDRAMLEVDGAPMRLETADELDLALEQAGTLRHTHACITVEAVERRPEQSEGGYREMAPSERVLVAKRMQSWIEAPPRAHLEGSLIGPGGLFLRALGLFAVAVAYWVLAGQAIFELFTGPLK